MKFLSYIILAVILNVSSCPKQKETQEIFKEIKFGEGGGFTGAIMEYTLDPNGDIFLEHSLSKEKKKLRTISKNEWIEIKKVLDRVPAPAFSFDNPGNLYYFIEIDKKRATWGDPSSPEPVEIKELYDQLQKLITP